MHGILFVISAPSGGGKTSLTNALLAADPAIHLSISYTTRPRRPVEVDGQNYHFVDTATFKTMQENGEFLETALVHDNYYGTSQAWIEAEMKGGNDILLEIDWQGAEQVRRFFPECVGLFILPPSMEELERRLRSRGQDSDAVIARRLAVARDEMSHAPEFNYVIINKDFDEAKRDVISVVRASRLHTARQLARCQDLFSK